MSAISPAEFDSSKLTISELKKLDNGSSMAFINYNRGPVLLQAPTLACPYGASDYKENKKFKVRASLRNRDSDPEMEAYCASLEAIDECVIDQAHKNAAKWFKMPGASRETIAIFYKRSIEPSKDKDGNPTDYPPTHSLSLKKKGAGYDLDLFNADMSENHEDPLTVLTRRVEIYPAVKAGSIWIADKKFGLTWNLAQACITKPGEGSAGPRRVMLLPPGGAKATPFANATVARASTTISAEEEENVISAVTPAEEEEEEEYEEAPPVPAPAVPVRKATVTPVAAVTAPTATATAVKKTIKKVVAKA
jgi:hypothetical protein